MYFMHYKHLKTFPNIVPRKKSTGTAVISCSTLASRLTEKSTLRQNIK